MALLDVVLAPSIHCELTNIAVDILECATFNDEIKPFCPVTVNLVTVIVWTFFDECRVNEHCLMADVVV